jgi:4'-phosphopantetheinyl transferase
MHELSALLGSTFRALETHHDGVTLVCLDVAPETPRPAGVLASLSADETARAARFVSVADRSRFALTRAALRQLLAAATGVPPEALVLATGQSGKPCLAATDAPHFNVSHSGSLALIGLSRLRPIGVDIEVRRDLSDLMGLAEACFSPREYRALSDLPYKARESAFYATWTGKEAVLKALGTGIAGTLRDFSVALDPAEFGSNRSEFRGIDTKSSDRDAGAGPAAALPRPARAGARYSLIEEMPSLVPGLAGVVLERIEVPAPYTAALALA